MCDGSVEAGRDRMDVEQHYCCVFVCVVTVFLTASFRSVET